MVTAVIYFNFQRKFIVLSNMEFKIILIIFTSFCAISQETEDDSRIIDLQVLLQNVSSVMQNCQEVCREHLKNLKDVQNEDQAQDCADLFLSGKRGSGIYSVFPLGIEKSFKVYCDMRTDGGGWTVFQRRGNFGNPQDYFFKGWDDYKAGFGVSNKEFWLGNDRLSALTLQGKYQLRVDLSDMNRETAFAKYESFWVEREDQNYKLHVEGYSGTAGDSLVAAHNHTERDFSTLDRGQTECAKTYRGGWWYNACHGSNLNGLNLKGQHESYADGVEWATFKGLHYSLYSEMKIRPVDFLASV